MNPKTILTAENGAQLYTNKLHKIFKQFEYIIFKCLENCGLKKLIDFQQLSQFFSSLFKGEKLLGRLIKKRGETIGNKALNKSIASGKKQVLVNRRRKSR